VEAGRGGVAGCFGANLSEQDLGAYFEPDRRSQKERSKIMTWVELLGAERLERKHRSGGGHLPAAAGLRPGFGGGTALCVDGGRWRAIGVLPVAPVRGAEVSWRWRRRSRVRAVVVSQGVQPIAENAGGTTGATKNRVAAGVVGAGVRR